jgi:hypothetical protein
MEQQFVGKELQVEVIDVFPEKNAVWIENENASGEYQIGLPAKINFAKKGPATIKFDAVGNIVYIRSNAPKTNTGFKSFPPKSYTPKPYAKPFTQASKYEPEEKESKRIGMCKEMNDSTLEEIRMMYNSLSIAGKWIVATNIFPRPDKPGKYDAMFYISEKREGFDGSEYLAVEEKAYE